MEASQFSDRSGLGADEIWPSLTLATADIQPEGQIGLGGSFLGNSLCCWVDLVFLRCLLLSYHRALDALPVEPFERRK